jgi:hypothetical protein
MACVRSLRRVCERADPESAPSDKPDRTLLPHRENAIDIAHAEARHAQQNLAMGRVDVDRKRRAMVQRPGELGIDLEVEIRGVGRRQLVDAKLVMPNEPVGFV